MFRFPWTNEHELNLDWLIRTVKMLNEKIKRVVTSVNGSTGDVVIPVPLAFNGTPAALGTAAPGNSEAYARGDHVHPMPTYADIGKGSTKYYGKDHMTFTSMINTNNSIVYVNVWENIAKFFGLQIRLSTQSGTTQNTIITFDEELSSIIGGVYIETPVVSGTNVHGSLIIDGYNHPNAVRVSLRMNSNVPANSYVYMAPLTMV